MNKEIVDAFVELKLLRVQEQDEFDRLQLMGTFARLFNAFDEMSVALVTCSRLTDKRELAN